MNKLLQIIMLVVLMTPLKCMAQRFQQKLDRAVVAVDRSGSTIRNVTSTAGTGSLISWRKLVEEPEGTTYNVYKRAKGASEYTKINAKPLKATCLSTTLANNTEYAVTAITPEGVEGEKSRPFLYKKQAYPNVWFDFDFDDSVIKRDDYRTKFAWPMDLDGNGEFDAIVVDRLFAGAASGDDDAENMSDNTATTSHKIQAYRLTGELLWTVDMGPNVNICAGQNDMVVAYDINCDGRCEVMIKSSDGTRFWDKANNTWGKYAKGSTEADVDGDGVVDYRSHSTRVPPFYVSVIDGSTGEEIACNELNYSEVHDGSDTWGRNTRSQYMSFGYAVMDGHFSICYLDGIHPSLVMECLDRDNNKNHHNYVFTWDYDWPAAGSNSQTPTNWHHSATWSRNDKKPWPAEFHQLRVADVNGDGCDEMIQGGYNVNPLKGWFRSPGIGHGDRFILSDIDPDRPGLEAFAIQQSDLLGQLIYDPATGEHIKEWYLPSVYDVGRGACLDIDDAHKGYEILSYADEFVYDCKGEKTGQTRTGSMYEGVWWDGRLQREWLNSPGGSGWGTNMMITRVLGDRLCEFSQESSWATHGGTGTRPAFMGDIIGDWREEIILPKQDASHSTGLVGYTTNIPTTYNIYCLQQDPHYRLDCTTRGYYQHPNTGFYLGGGMPMPPLPPVFTADLRWKGSSKQAAQGVAANDGFVSFDMSQTATYTDGKSLMFDLSGDNSSIIMVDKPFSAPLIYLMNPKGHDYELQSTHLWGTDAVVTTGSGTLIKSMQGKASLSGWLRHTGPTIISEGTLQVNGDITGPVELRAKGTLSGNVTLKDTIVFEGALNYEGCRLMLSSDDDYEGIATSEKSVTLPGNVYLELSAGFVGNSEEAWAACGKLLVLGNLTFKGTNYLTVNLNTPDVAAEYTVAECTGKLTCDVTKLKTRGLEGINYDLKIVDDKRLVLVINATRPASDNVLWTGIESNTWDYKAQNFQTTAATAFVAGDQVVFNDAAAKKTVSVPEMVVTAGVIFDAGKYTLSGDGGLSGEGGVTVNRAADVTLNMKYSDYTGATVVNGGTLTVPNFYDGGQKSALGATAAKEGGLVLNGGTLVLSKDNMATDRVVTLTDTATIRISSANSSLSLKGQVKGTGYLVKDGPGRLNFNYGGNNNFQGIIVKKGSVAQGTWNSTFGKVGGPMVLAGGEVDLIDNNNTSTMPTFNYVTTVQEGTTNTLVGSSRGKINGSFRGKGSLTIRTKYVRCDVGASFKDFEGSLTAIGEGGNFRLMTSANDLSKARLTVGAATTFSFMASGSGSEASGTLKIGTLQGSAADGVLGGSQSSYQAGFLGEDSKFSGLLKGQRFTKVGAGKLTLVTAGHTSPITVGGGVLIVQNSSATAFTSAAVTVANGGTLEGTALLQSVTVQKGGTILGGLETTGLGTLRLNGNLTMNEGATLRCLLGNSTGNTQLSVKGKITHSQDTLVIVVPATRQLNVGDEIQVFATGFSTASGDVIVRCECADYSYEFDTSLLNSEGKVSVKSVVSGMQQLPADDAMVDVYTTGGQLLRSKVTRSRALEGLPSGVYVFGNGMKVRK